MRIFPVRAGAVTAMIALMELLASSGAWATSDPGRVGFGFLRLGGGARPTAMGSLGTTMSRGSESLAWNSALLANRQALRASATALTWLEETTAGHVAVSRGFGTKGVGGIFLQGLTMSDFSNVPGETVDGQSDLALGAAWSRNLWGDLDGGIAAKFLRSKLAGESATGGALDLGLNYRYVDGWNVAAAVRDFGPSIGYGDGPEDQLPTQAAIGFSGTIRGFVFGSEMQWENGRGWDGGLGAEYVWRDLLAVRGGSRIAADSNDAVEPWAAGLGVKVGSAWEIDYSFQDGLFDPSHRVAVSWRADDGEESAVDARPDPLSARDFYVATLEEALDRAMANFPENVADTLGVRAKTASDADTLIGAALERRLRARGYEVVYLKPLVAVPANVDSTKAEEVAEKIRQANAASSREVVLEFEPRTSVYSIDRRRRLRFIGPPSMDRSARIDVALRLLKAGETESLWSSTGEADRRETVDARRVPFSPGYPPSGGVAVDSKGLHPLVEPAIVGGIVTGLVLIFFSNRDVGE
jgi:hypothetical protein